MKSKEQKEINHEKDNDNEIVIELEIEIFDNNLTKNINKEINILCDEDKLI